MKTSTYVIHDLLVRSQVPLPAPETFEDRCDVVVRWNTTALWPSAPPRGEVLASVGLPDGAGYTLVRQADEYVLRVGALAEFRIDAGLSQIDVVPAPQTNLDFIPLLLAGNVLATLLTLRGEHVLHASAVALNGRALGFAGHSGTGKSTLAALFCAGSASLIADDTLRLVRDGGRVSCAGGGAQIRLRPGAADLAGRIPSSRTSACADGRIGVEVPQPIAQWPLHALLIPSRCDGTRSLRLTRLAPSDALFALVSRCRIGGWRDADVLRARLEGLGRLTREVPVYGAEIPWSNPFSPEIARDIADAVGLSHQFARA